MGLFRRRTKYRVETPAGPVAPGQEMTVTLRASKVRDGTQLGQVVVDVRCSGKKEASGPQSEGLATTQVSTSVRWLRQEIEVGRTLAQPEDAVELTVRLPWWSPVVRVGAHELLGVTTRPEVVVGRLDYGRAQIEVEALPFHHELFAVTDALGWRYQRCQVWDVGGTKRPAEQRLWFHPGDSGDEPKGFKIAHLEVVPVAAAADRGTVSVDVVARKLGVGLFSIGRLADVPLTNEPAAAEAAIRSGLAQVIAGARTPDGSALDAQVLEALVRIVLR